MTRAGDHRPRRGEGPEPSPEAPADSPALAAILARLGGEIGRPLEVLRSGIVRLIDDPARSISEAERLQARTMLGLCDDLGRLTRECMEGGGPTADAPSS